MAALWPQTEGRRLEWYPHTSIWHLPYAGRTTQTYGMFDQILWWYCCGRKPSFRMAFHLLALFGHNRKEGNLNHTLIYPYSVYANPEEQYRPMACSIKYFGAAAVGETLVVWWLLTSAVFGPNRKKGDFSDTLIHPYSAHANPEEQYRPMACSIKYFGGAAVGETLVVWWLLTSSAPTGRKETWMTHSYIHIPLDLCRKTNTDLWHVRSSTLAVPQWEKP